MLGNVCRSPGIFLTFLLGCCLGILLERSWNSYSDNSALGLANPKVTCLIIVRNFHFRNINASKATWLRKCDDYLIVQVKKRKQMLAPTKETCQQPEDVVPVDAESGWGFLCSSLRLLPRPVQWLIIVPDSATVIVENLKHFLRARDWRQPSYFGHTLTHYSGDFNVLSAGIVLSNETLTRVLHRFTDKESCQKGGTYWNNEDLLLGQHLRELGVATEDTRDGKGRGRFHGFNINTLLNPGKIFRQTDYFKKAVYPVKEGTDCCSPDLITLDATDSDHLLLQYFLMYGIGTGGGFLPPSPAPTNEGTPPWVQSLRVIGYTGPTEGLTAEQYYQIWAKYMPPEAFNEKLREVVAK